MSLEDELFIVLSILYLHVSAADVRSCLLRYTILSEQYRRQRSRGVLPLAQFRSVHLPSIPVPMSSHLSPST
jgi:hypothetical protein